MERKSFLIKKSINKLIILSTLIALISSTFIPAAYSGDISIDNSQEPIIADLYENINEKNFNLEHPIITTQTFGNQRSDGLWINVTKEIAPKNIHPCEPSTIFINVSVEGEPTIDYAPINVVLVIDRSGSMSNIFEGNTTLSYIKEAAKNFVGELNFSKDKVGVVSYGSQATIEQPLTDDGVIANSSIDTIYLRSNSWENGTNTGDALRLAKEHLLGNLTEGAVPVIVLFSDGCPSFHGLSQNINEFNWQSYFCYENCPTYNNTCVLWARNNAADAKNNGITIFSVGFFDALCESCYNPYNCNEVTSYAQWLMKDIATDPAKYFNAPAPSDIENVFQNISQEISEIILTNLTIEDYLPENIVVLSTNGGTYTDYINGTQKVTFTKESLSLNSTWHNSFNITSEQVGSGIITNFDYSRFIYTKNFTQNIQFLPYPVFLNVTNPLIIDKVSPPIVEPDQLFNYTITVENIGHLVLENVVIEDILPENVTFTPSSMYIHSNYSGFNEDNWQYDAMDHCITIDNITLDIGQSIFIVIAVRVKVNAEGLLENTANAGYTEQDGICESLAISNSTIYTEVLTGNPDISIVKFVDPSVTTSNADVSYVIIIENTGDCQLTQVTIIDVLPENSSYVSDDHSGVEGPPGKITWILGSFDSGDIFEIHMLAHVNNAPSGVLVNHVNVTGHSIYGDVNDSAIANLTIIHPDIDITKTADPTITSVDHNVTFTMMVENTGDCILDPVFVDDYLPNKMNYVSDDSGGVEAPGNMVWWDLGLMNPGDIINITMIVHIQPGATVVLTNIVNVTAGLPDGGVVTDWDYANVTIIKPAIQVSKSAFPTIGAPSTNVTFTIVVENTGDCDFYTVEIYDLIPEGMSYVSDDSGGIENPQDIINWELGPLNVSDNITIHLVCHIDNNAESTLYNYVNATGFSECGFVADGAEASVQVLSPGIKVTKTVNHAIAHPLTILNYTIVVENTGDCILDPVLVEDMLPNEVSYISDDSGGIHTNGFVNWSIGPLGIGENVTIHMLALIMNASSEILINHVNATGFPQYGGPVSDYDCANVTVYNPNIKVTKTVNQTVCYPNTNVTFTIVVENTGINVLNPVTVIDWLPIGMSYVSDDSGGVEGPTGTIVWDNIGPMNPSDVVTITLIAHINTNASGLLINIVNASGYDPAGYPVGMSDDANVTVIQSNMAVKKEVKYNCNGPYNDEGIIIDLDGPHGYDWCSFRINVTNNYDQPANVTIKDIIPDGLTDGNHYKPRAPDYKDGNELIWYFDGSHAPLIGPGQKVTIELRADMGDCGIRYLNHVYVTTYIGDLPPLLDIDTAYVEWINCEAEYPIDINQSIYDRGFPIRHAVDGDWGAAQNFTPNVNVITSVDLYLRKYGIPEFDILIQLREGSVDGAVIDEIMIPKSLVTGTWQWFDIDFANTAVTAGTEYYIVIPPAPNNVTNSNGYEWGYAFGDIYFDGCLWFTRDSGMLWRDLPSMYDFTFRTYGYL